MVKRKKTSFVVYKYRMIYEGRNVKQNRQNNIVDEIKSRCDIVDVVGRVVSLKKAGSNYKGVCPFHNEKTPSFVVSETKQIYTCFGCGASGDVLSFVEKYYGLDFKGSVEMLAKEYGISLEGAFRSSGNRDELYEINRQAALFFFRAMRSGANPGYTYMKRRGISEETLNEFGIGYADGEWSSLYDHLRSMGYRDDKLLELGLISRSDKGRCYDKFRNRVIFPIINTGGKVIGFGGRIIGEGEPKYLNSQESAVFRKKNNLYGLNLSRKEAGRQDAIILVEGYMDVVSLYQAGVRNVSASLGTALTENQAKLIRRYTKNVILSYDADSAGQNAAFRGLDVLYKAGCRARVLKVTNGKDPDEFIRKNGRKAFADLVQNAVPYGDFKINMVRSRYDTDDEMQRVDFIRDAVAVLREMKPVEADIYIKKLAAETGISEGAIRFEYSGNNSQESSSHYRAEHDKKRVEDEMPLVEQELIQVMLADERLVKLPEDLENSAFRSNAGRSIYGAIRKIAGSDEHISSAAVRDMLDDDVAVYLDMIERRVLPAGRESKIFDDCIRNVRKGMLRQQEAEILAKLSMADEDENHEKIIQFTQELIEIQKKLKE